jgi:ubiquinone/menaquinone biosynthesis C-methylase UbiE
MVAGVLPRDRVLDVGCNSGYIVDFLHPECVVFGVDVSEELVKKARPRLIEAVVAPAEDLPYADRSMDVVIIGELLEHVYDPEEVVREAARVARRLVAGSTPHEAGKWGPTQKSPESHRFHVRCFDAPTLRATLERAGLTDIELETVQRDGVPQMYVFRGKPCA